MTGTLITVEIIGPDASRYELGEEAIVGRSADCQISIPDPKVSRNHAVIRNAEGALTIEDLGSSNGTFVNGTRAEGATAIKHGDSIRFESHTFTVHIPSEAVDLDDATIIADAPEEDVTIIADPEPEVAPEPKVETPSAVPGSWVDGQEGGDHTQFLDASALGSRPESVSTERMSDLAHVIVLASDGQVAEVMELALGSGESPDMWEVGRDEACTIAIADRSVSGKHAQLIHDKGRWRIVNLVSANGVFVNGEKRLNAYLADEDQIRLGEVTIVFRGPLGGAKPAPKPAAKPAAAKATESSGGGMMKIVIAVAVLAAAGAAAFFLM